MGRQRNRLYLLSALLLFLSEPPFPFFYLAFVALLPLLLSLSQCSFRKGLSRSFLCFFLFFALHTFWITQIFSIGIAALPALFLLALYTACLPAIALALYARFFSSPNPLFFLGGASLYTLAELIKGIGPLRFTWGTLGLTQSHFLPLAEIASLISVYGITFLLVFFNLSLTWSLKKRKIRLLFPAAGMLLLSLVYGFFALSTSKQGKALTVRLVQTGFDKKAFFSTPLSKRYTLQQSILQRTFELSQSKPLPNLILTAETTLTEEWSRSFFQTMILNQSRSLKSPFLLGTFYKKKNVALLLKKGQIQNSYAKHLLVLFSEVVPFYRWFRAIGFNPWGEEHENLEPGRTFPKLEVQHIPFAVQICYETTFPFFVRAQVRKGAAFLVAITADSWFPPWMSAQQTEMYRMRAIENGRYAVRVADVGISVVFDAKGRELLRLPYGTPAARNIVIQTYTFQTFFTRYGHFLFIVPLLLIGLAFRKSFLERQKANL